MRAVVQRVASAAVTVGGPAAPREIARIDRGLLALVGVEREDGPADVDYIAGKLATCASSRTPPIPRST